jgi:hypothetical protein
VAEHDVMARQIDVVFGLGYDLYITETCWTALLVCRRRAHGYVSGPARLLRHCFRSCYS